MSSLHEKLEREVCQAYWRDLAVHAMRDVLFVVEPLVSLLEAGVALAENRVDLVQRWIDGGAIHRPSREDIEAWQQGKVFESLIVAPYVLIQEAGLPNEDVAPAEEITWDELIRFLKGRGER